MIQFIWNLSLIGILLYMGCSIKIIIISGIILSLVTIYLFLMVIKPIDESEKIINFCISRDIDDDRQWKKLIEKNAIFEKIEPIIEKRVAQKTHENYVEMFDKEAKLTALQSQINPHFLYNTLESIRGQALIDDNVEIAKMVEALSAFFRYSISRKGNLVTLRDELANIQNYMMIQRYRFNNRFSLEIFIDEEDEEAYDYLVPKLIIQPVIENAIFHGLEERLEGGKVEIEVIVTENNLILTVSDNGVGMDNKSLTELNNRIHATTSANEEEKSKELHTGIALPNIHKRIQLLFGKEYGLNVYSTLNQGTDVEIMIPANYERNIR